MKIEHVTYYVCQFCGKRFTSEKECERHETTEMETSKTLNQDNVKTEGKMIKIAKRYGKKLNEIFEVFKKECGCAHVRFTKTGLEMVHPSTGKVFTRNDIEDYGFSVCLEDLLDEDAVIINNDD